MADKDYRVHTAHYPFREVGFVSSDCGKNAMVEAKKSFPWLVHPVLFNRADYRRALKEMEGKEGKKESLQGS